MIILIFWKVFTEQKSISYLLLSNQKVQTILADDIVNAKDGTDSKHYAIPYPSIVVIDNKTNAIDKHFFKGYKKRIKFADLYLQLNSSM